MSKPILCLDFDGVIHRYDSGWKGPLVITDGVTDGFFEWLSVAQQHFQVVVYSSRSKEPGAAEAMSAWLLARYREWCPNGDNRGVALGDLTFAHEKPAAFLTIDDRALPFEGDWSAIDPAALVNFRPWNKRAKAQGGQREGD